MSKIGEWLAWHINQLFPPLEIHRELVHAKMNISANQKWAYEEAVRIIFAFQPYWDLREKSVLDIGCGLGGKLAFLAEARASKIVALDIDLLKLQIVDEYIHKNDIADFVFIATADAASLPFPEQCFDAVVSINTFEHILGLEDAIRETYRVLRPGGYAYLYLPPYYSPWGPHLENWIHFPWPHLLFSDQTLLRVAAREDAQRGINQHLIPSERIDWSAERIPNVNRVTLHRFDQLVRQVGFNVVQRRLLHVGYSFLSRGPKWFRVADAALRLSTHIPLLREVMVTKMAYVLTRPL